MRRRLLAEFGEDLVREFVQPRDKCAPVTSGDKSAVAVGKIAASTVGR